MFDHQILDMFELGVENYKGLASFKVTPLNSTVTKLSLLRPVLYDLPEMKEILN